MRIADPFKYCPNCAYRLRPDVTPTPKSRVPRSRPGRLVALGGYLAFGSMLLLVVLAGIRLFEEKEVFLGVAEQTGVARDSDVLRLSRPKSFRRVEGGDVAWGANIPPRGPVTEAVIDHDFDLGVHEVTNDQFYEFLEALAKALAARSDPVTIPASYYPPHWSRLTGDTRVRHMYAAGEGNMPVTSIEFGVAQVFCAWFWEARLGSNPDVIVDLPTADEYIRAARGDNVEDNFPWGERLERDEAVLEGDLKAVNKEVMPGFAHLIGNAAEWVYGLDPEQTPNAAGWSIFSDDQYARWESARPETMRSPFEKSQLEPLPRGPARPHVGFRLILRQAPAVPRFVRVPAGVVRHRPFTKEDPPALFPPLVDENIPEAREPAVSFKAPEDRVEYNFEIAQDEITNRQYLAFLVAKIEDGKNLLELIPASFTRRHPFGDWDRFEVEHGDPAWATGASFSKLISMSPFVGPYGPPSWIPFVYPAGMANRPAQGVTQKQAAAYADWLSKKLESGTRFCRLPTVAEYLRAGRQDALTPYPWGDDPLRSELVCSGRRDDEDRAISLSGRFGTAANVIHGLVGNLPEIVEHTPERFLLAGGFFKLPAECCTLDTFVDFSWLYVEADIDGELIQFNIAQYAGFRVVRVGF